MRGNIFLSSSTVPAPAAFGKPGRFLTCFWLKTIWKHYHALNTQKVSQQPPSWRSHCARWKGIIIAGLDDASCGLDWHIQWVLPDGSDHNPLPLQVRGLQTPEHSHLLQVPPDDQKIQWTVSTPHLEARVPCTNLALSSAPNTVNSSNVPMYTLPPTSSSWQLHKHIFVSFMLLMRYPFFFFTPILTFQRRTSWAYWTPLM